METASIIPYKVFYKNTRMEFLEYLNINHLSC